MQKRKRQKVEERGKSGRFVGNTEALPLSYGSLFWASALPLAPTGTWDMDVDCGYGTTQHEARLLPNEVVRDSQFEAGVVLRVSFCSPSWTGQSPKIDNPFEAPPISRPTRWAADMYSIGNYCPDSESVIKEQD